MRYLLAWVAFFGACTLPDTSLDAGIRDVALDDVFEADVNALDVLDADVEVPPDANPPELLATYIAPPPSTDLQGTIPALIRIDHDTIAPNTDVHFVDSAGTFLKHELNAENSDARLYWVGLESPSATQNPTVMVMAGAQAHEGVFDGYTWVEHFNALPTEASNPAPEIVELNTGRGMQLSGARYAVLGRNLAIGQNVETITVWVRLEAQTPASQAKIFALGVGVPNDEGRSRLELNYNQNRRLHFISREEDNAPTGHSLYLASIELSNFTVVGLQRNYLLGNATFWAGDAREQQQTNAARTVDTPSLIFVVGSNEDLQDNQLLDGTIDELRILEIPVSEDRFHYESLAMASDFFSLEP